MQHTDSIHKRDRERLRTCGCGGHAWFRLQDVPGFGSKTTILSQIRGVAITSICRYYTRNGVVRGQRKRAHGALFSSSMEEQEDSAFEPHIAKHQATSGV